ncbi:MAG: alpha/beta fold hydrolase [Candidatus Shapirobacteria bacterium]
MIKRIFIISILAVFILGGIVVGKNRSSKNLFSPIDLQDQGGLIDEPIPLSIEYMRQQEYPGSEIVIEQTLPPGSNYNRYLVSYRSDGLKIYALLTVPLGEKPEGGWPAIVFNHGYIQPEQYRTTEKYLAYTDAFSKNGYIVFKPDFRGHGNSEGKPEGAYYSSAYTIDVLNAVSSLKNFEEVNPEKIGMWGHSMGGMITLRSMAVTKDIKVGEVWAGVVASYEDLAKNWHHPVHNPQPWVPSQREQAAQRPGRQELIDQYGDFEQNPQFWQSISPISFVSDISGPIQLQHGTADAEVPLLFSQELEQALKKANKPVELFVYENDNHNLSNNLTLALKRSVEFFDKYLKI